ncbi:MAG: hypothetical protein EHM23_22520 [Acidobacteria bacterium]|nr:MAG: hypothetical protein EHM23_22520 [Acidobacteriota bacterium]
MEKTIGMEIGADSGLKFGEISMGLSRKFTSQLKWSESHTEEIMTETEKEVEITYPEGPRCCLAGYSLVDRLSLWRADGVIVTDPWDVVNEMQRREDGFPDSAVFTRATRKTVRSTKLAIPVVVGQ